MIRRKYLAAAAVVSVLVLVFGAARLPAIELDRGTIAGAHYAIATPDSEWNGHVLLLAHGYRSENAPLVADLQPAHTTYATLLREGWIIGKTSYRRNGLIVADGVSDLVALRQHIAATYGQPTRVIVKGDSMGGTIVTLMAEQNITGFDGYVAIGAALDLREPGQVAGLSLAPQRPFLFIANRSEFEGPRAYVEAQIHPTPDRPMAVLFRINRDGHVNVNQAERLFAVRSLMTLIERGAPALPAPSTGDAYYDATQIPSPGPSQVRVDADNRGLTARVQEISAIYGNAWLNIQPADLETIGLKRGTWFQLHVGDSVFRTRYGSDFSSVERGQWVMFPNADGFVWLSRNWANAAETADLNVGDEIQIRRYSPTDR